MNLSDNKIHIGDLKNIDGYDNIFHTEIIVQHGQFYLFNRHFDLSDCVKFNTEIYSPLNEANVMLGRFMKRIINEQRPLTSMQLQLQELDYLILEWQHCYNKGGAFKSYGYAAKIAELLAQSGISVKQAVQNEQTVTKAFINIPFEVKAQFQIGVVIAEEHVFDFFEQLLAELRQDSSLSYYILEVKVSSGLDDRATKLFRNIKFILNPKIINTKLNPIVWEVASLLSSNAYVMPMSERNEFYYPHQNTVSIAQAAVNYKLFLQLLGVLDQVYDPKSNHAFLN